jgi:hypothetical protein
MSRVAPPKAKPVRRTRKTGARIGLSTRRRSKAEDRLDGDAAIRALRESAERIPYQTGLEAREREKRTFFELADRLAQSTDAVDQKRLKEELARMTFGD